MKRPRILVLCCGAGGCSMGYWIAGFEVVGVDINPQPNYPFEFHQDDAMTYPLDGFDAVHAGPPCQAYSRTRHRNMAHTHTHTHTHTQWTPPPKLIEPLRERFEREIPGVPYVIENVEDALPEMIGPGMLCGSSFGLRVRRHRYFETNWDLDTPDCDHAWQDGHKPYRLYVGKARTAGRGHRESGIQPVYGGNHNVGGNSLYRKSVAMGIDWMTEKEINESIPPAYSEFIGRQLIEELRSGSMSRPKAKCSWCKKDVTVTEEGVLRVHGPLADRCPGSGDKPAAPAAVGPAEDTKADQGDSFPAVLTGSGQPNPHRAPLPTAQPGAERPLTRMLSDGPGTAAQADPDEGDAWLGGSADDDEADAWLDGPAGDGADRSGPGKWFEARYDGDCDTCFRHVDAGDEIRADGEGGYQCRACADEDESESAEDVPVPRKVRPKVPIEQGRYRMPHPVTGKKWAGSRVTTFVKLASDHMALKLWELRTAVVGLTLSPELQGQIAALVENGLAHNESPSVTVKKSRVPLDALVEQAKRAAGAGERASKGTLLHKWAEEVDSGRRTVADVPEEHQEDVAAHVQGMAAAGITVLPHLIERTTAVRALGVIGTFDRVFRMPDGKYRVGDTKTGSLVYGQDEIAAQMAIYAHGCNETGIAEWDGEGNPRDWESWRWVPLTDEDGNAIHVEEDWGVVMHLPQGERVFQPYEADLVTGWRGAQLCSQVRDWHRVKSTLTPMSVPDPETPPESQLPPGDRMLTRLAAEVGNPGTVADRIAEAAKGAHWHDAVSADPLTPAIPGAPWTPEEVALWKPRADGVRTAAEATQVYRAAVSARLPELQRAELVARMRQVLDGQAPPRPAPEPAPEPPQETELERAVRTAVRVWQHQFETVATRDEALGTWREARAAGVPQEALEQLTEIGRRALAEAHAPVAEAVPGNPPETRRKAPEQAVPAPSAPDWETAFADVQDSDQALELWRRAKASGVPEGRLEVLTQTARRRIQALRDAALPPVAADPWAERAAAVATREQASALYAEMRAPGSGLARERILELLEVMKQAVPA